MAQEQPQGFAELWIVAIAGILTYLALHHGIGWPPAPALTLTPMIAIPAACVYSHIRQRSRGKATQHQEHTTALTPKLR